MTEQEIVNYLKGNLNKGVAFGFMPREVRQYITSNFKNLLFLDGENQWIKTLERQECWSNMVFALPEDFELPPKPQGEWVEFEINGGKFSCILSDVDKLRSRLDGLDGVFESWWNWQEFLTVSSKFDLGFTAFGGWQYEGSTNWHQFPILIKTNGQVLLGSDDSDDVKPAIPTKIRFWRERK